MNLPYNQFTNINFLSSTERLYKSKNYIPYKFKNPTKIWNNHIKSNKYFEYIYPLDSHFYKENSYKSLNKKKFKDLKKENKKTNNLLYILYKLNFEDIDNFNNLWSEIYDKIKKNSITDKFTWYQFFKNKYNNNNAFNHYNDNEN